MNQLGDPYVNIQSPFDKLLHDLRVKTRARNTEKIKISQKLDLNVFERQLAYFQLH